MREFGRSAVAVIAGTVLAVLLIAAIQKLGHMVYPVPSGIDWSDADRVREYIAGLPPGALLFVLAAYGIGTLAGAFLAARLSTRAPVVHASIVTALMLASGIGNLVAIPHPAWFAAATVIVFIVAGIAGGRLGSSGADGAAA